MRKKGLVAAAGLLLALAAILYTAREPKNPFPLSAVTIEAAFAAQELDWELRETQSFMQGHETHMVYNQNDKATATLTSYEAVGNRGLVLQLLYPGAASSISEAVGQEQWPQMFALAFGLYGGPANTGRLYRQLASYLETEAYEPRERQIRWLRKAGNMHLVVTVMPSKKYYGQFDLQQIELMNSRYYEEYLAMWQSSREIHLELERQRATGDARWRYSWES